jgi:hypothetical protein
MTKWTTRNGLYADKYKEKENLVVRINEITNSTEKLELLRMIDAAIWQAMDAESFYADNETEAEQGVAATPTANQAIAQKPIATQTPIQKPVKKLTQQQQAHVKTLDHKQLLNYIKTNLKAPAPVPTKATPKPATNINPTPNNNNNQSNSSFDTVNAKDDAAKYKNGESDRLA